MERTAAQLAAAEAADDTFRLKTLEDLYAALERQLDPDRDETGTSGR